MQHPPRSPRHVKGPPRNPALRRPWPRAMLRGARGLCPACGHGALFASGVKVAETCPRCGEELYHHRADRLCLPIAAFTALQLVALLMMPAHVLGVHWPLWGWGGGWLLATMALARPVKGAIVGLQWALRLHGFQYAAMCRPRPPE